VVRRTVVLVGGACAVAGVLLTIAGAAVLVDDGARGLALAFALAAGAAFFGLSFCAETVLAQHTDLTGILHWLAMSVLTLLAVIGFGYLAVSWTQHSAVAVRLLADAGVAILAGATAALFVVGAGIAVMLALKLAAALGPRARRSPTADERVAGIRVEEERWRPPWSRLPYLVARTVGLSVGGVSLSVAAQWPAYKLDLSPSAQKLIVPALAWVVGSACVWWLVGGWLHFTPSHHRTRHLVHAVGLATLVLAVSTTVFGELAANRAKGRLWQTHHGASYGAIGARPTLAANQRDQALAEEFAPALRFSGGESWHPTSVEWFKKTARLLTPFRDSRGKIRCAHTCLALDCDDASGECTRDAPSQPTIYALVKHSAGSIVPRGYEDLSTIIEYWLFYDYDSFQRWPISQWHQADWEQIAVGLAGTTPRFVGYSEHCFGTWLPWSRVEVDARGSTHPVAYVAEGTHANYPRAFDFPLRGASCARPAQPRYFGAVAFAFALAEPSGRLEVAADYAFGETDRIGHETLPRIDVRVVNPSDPKLAAFPGTWGLDNRLAFGRSKTGNYAGGGPDSPAHHGEWKDPGANILCDRTWFTPPKRPRCHPVNT
jgi:hypothetical protein